MKLQNKTVLITGSSKGIDRACAEAFAEQGAHVIINYVHDEKAAQEVAESIMAKYRVKTLVVQADIAIQDQVDAMFNKIQSVFPKLDVLVNNSSLLYTGS